MQRLLIKGTGGITVPLRIMTRGSSGQSQEFTFQDQLKARKFKYIILEVLKVRGWFNGQVSFSQLQFYRDENTIYEYLQATLDKAGQDSTSLFNDLHSFGGNETFKYALMHELISGHVQKYKYCGYSDGLNPSTPKNPAPYFLIDVSTKPIDLGVYDKWRWYFTADSYSQGNSGYRDMKEFNLYVTNGDPHDKSSWKLVGDQSDGVLTEQPGDNTIGFYGNLNLNRGDALHG